LLAVEIRHHEVVGNGFVQFVDVDVVGSRVQVRQVQRAMLLQCRGDARQCLVRTRLGTGIAVVGKVLQVFDAPRRHVQFRTDPVGDSDGGKLLLDLWCVPPAIAFPGVAIGILVHQAAELVAGLPFLEADFIGGNDEKVREVRDVLDVPGSLVEERQFQLAWLCVILEYVGLIFLVDGRGKFDMPAFGADFSPHLLAGEQRDDVAAAGLHLANRCLHARLQDQFSSSLWRAEMIEQVGQLCSR
jgi:hypothetical protein